MRDTMQSIRWRLFIGVVSLIAAVSATLPLAASKVDLSQRIGELAPNAFNQVADIIWPNGAEYLDIIWPNAAVFGGFISSDGNSQGQQDNSQN